LFFLFFRDAFRFDPHELLSYPEHLVSALGSEYKLVDVRGQNELLLLVFPPSVRAPNLLGGAVFDPSAVPVETQEGEQVFAVDECGARDGHVPDRLSIRVGLHFHLFSVDVKSLNQVVLSDVRGFLQSGLWVGWCGAGVVRSGADGVPSDVRGLLMYR
jgi:hypothetical protein